MTNSDTLRIRIDRSICDYQGYEELIITKVMDSLKIVSRLNDSYTTDNEWKEIYETMLSEKDTMWRFGNFLINNKDKLKTKASTGRLVISDGQTELAYYSETGLIASLNFMTSINETMEVLYPNKDYYVVRVPTLIKE